MLRLDHIVVAVGYDLEAAMADYRSLGFTVVYGGVHASGATHNALIWFPDTTFIELLALTGNDPKPGVADYSPLVVDREGLVGYALRTDDLFWDSEDLRGRLGRQVGDPIESGRLRPDGVRLAWKNALVNDGYAPFLIEYLSPPDSQRLPSDPLTLQHRCGAKRLCAVDFERGIVRLEAPVTAQFNQVKAHGVIYQPVPQCE